MPLCPRSTVAVLIPHYKCEEWLSTCLRSIVGQTRVPEAIVVIDDASDSPPVEIVRAFPSVTLLHATGNVGPYRLIQQVIQETNFDGYMFQDADDWSGPMRLELLLKEAERTGAELIGCQEMRLAEDNAGAEAHYYHPLVKERALKLLYGCPLLHPTSVVSRKLVMRLGGYAAVRFGGDAEFLRRAIWDATVTNAPYLCYFRRRRPDALTSSAATGASSPARREHRVALADRTRKAIVAAAKGEPVDLSPSCTAAPVMLSHLCGPRIVSDAGSRSSASRASKPQSSQLSTRTVAEDAPDAPPMVIVFGDSPAGVALVHATLAQHPRLTPLTAITWLAGVERTGKIKYFPAPSRSDPISESQLTETPIGRLAADLGLLDIPSVTWVDGSTRYGDLIVPLSDAISGSRFVFVADSSVKTSSTVRTDQLTGSRLLNIASAELEQNPTDVVRRLLSFAGVDYREECVLPLSGDGRGLRGL